MNIFFIIQTGMRVHCCGNENEVPAQVKQPIRGQQIEELEGLKLAATGGRHADTV